MPAFPLKTYQRNALSALMLFLRQSQTMGLEAAWAHAGRREGRPATPYRNDDLAGAPCVCLRIPTGGGKTLMASHAIVGMGPLWAQNVNGGDYPVALWLVPSDTIRSQTLSALQTPGHPYRAALEEAYKDAFVVCELDALHNLPANEFGRKTVVVVATIQSFRVSNKAGRRVYAMSEAWEAHFRALNLSPQDAAARGLECVTQADLDTDNPSFLTPADLGRVKTSLANWLAYWQPLVLVDEAHNAKTPLSLIMLQAIRPSAVLDLTATPVPHKTNVLYSVSARELEAEDMIKLPIMLAEHATSWQDAVRDALLRRSQLEGEAAHERDYIRPIVLFQAQDKNQAVPPEVLKAHLMSAHGIAAADIAVVTGTQRELDGIVLQAPDCTIRYVITVDALKEGWDCSFAYVLCSLQNLRSNQAVEQLLGRVLRMPYATKRQSPALNRAYAHVIARNFGEAANNMVDSLTQSMGFDALSAAAVVLPDADDLFDGGFGEGLGATSQTNTGQTTLRPERAPLVLDIALTAPDTTSPSAAAEVATRATAALAGQPDLRIHRADEASVSVQLTGSVSEGQRIAIFSIVLVAHQTSANRQIDHHNARITASLAPANRQVLFAPIPQLCIRIGRADKGSSNTDSSPPTQGTLELIERETLGELMAFDLLREDPRPELPGFNLVQQSDMFEIYVEGERVRVKQGDAAQLSLDGVATDASENDVIRELARHIKTPCLTQTEAQAYVQRLVGHLLRERNFSLTGLLRSRFQLSLAITARIESVQTKVRAAGFQALLFGTLAGDKHVALASSPACQFRFEAGRYPVRDAYTGRWQFNKHYFDEIAKLKSQGEEFDCAVALDTEPATRHWVRNLEQQPQFAFWLPTATDYFYPDFVAELKDGRILVVEYKGDGYASNDDSREKRLVGERWAQTTGQVFAMVEKTLNGQTMAQQIRAATQ